MESKRQARPADPDADPAWKIVRRWPGIRGEPKLAWWYLWRMSGQGGQQCVVKAVDLGADQNTSDDAGARYLRTLAREGLIRADDLTAGRKLVTLFDPLDVAKARRACGGDSQLAFGFAEEILGELEAEGAEYPPAEVVGHVPTAVPAIGLASEPRWDADARSAVPPSEPRSLTAVPPSEPRSAADPPSDPPSEPPAEPPAEPRRTVPLHVEVRERIASRARAPLTKDKDKDNKQNLSKTETLDRDSARSNQPNDLARRRGSEGGTAVAPATLGEVLGAIDLAAAGEAFESALERAKARIRDAVGDPSAEPVVIALAHAYADSRVKGPDFDRLLARVASGLDGQGRPIGNRGGFFRRQVAFKFRDLGIAPEDYFPSKPKPR